MTEYLTTKELADLLRIKQRKVYDMAAKGEIPCSRAMGKLLFPRDEVEAWVAGAMAGPAENATAAAAPAMPVPARPKVFLGSHDPLLEWALRESRSGLATFFDGSEDGLDRFAQGEGLATGLHIYDPGSDTWNIDTVATRFAHTPVVLVEFAWRSRGLIVRADETAIAGPRDLAGRRIAPRQDGAGSQTLLRLLLDRAGLCADDMEMTDPMLTETDAAQAVAEGRADAALGLAGLAEQWNLGFRPVVDERFDLLVDRHAWFEPPFQAFLEFCRGPRFAKRAQALGGYRTEGLGRVQFNGT